MATMRTISIVLWLLSSLCAVTALNMSRPQVFAHRGYSGILPEHTLEAYAAAIDAGADFVECDIVLTADCDLVCRHEPNVLSTTNARTVYPELIRNYTVDGVNEEGIFSNDMTVDQIKNLTAIQRVDFRDQNYNRAGFKVPTFREYLTLLQSAPRVVGAVPETKHPTFFDSLRLQCMNGTTFTDLVAKQLTEMGYKGPFMSPEWMQKPILVQSFEVDNLRYLNRTYGIPAYQLIDEDVLRTADASNISNAALMTDEGLRNISQYAVVVAPWKNNFVPVNSTTNQFGNIDFTFVPRAHALGLLVNTWTMRDEPTYLANEYNADPWAEYDFFIHTLGVDGLFTDFTATLVDWLSASGYMPAVSSSQPALTIGTTTAVAAASRATAQSDNNIMPPYVIARGGSSWLYPANTREAFQAAIEEGADLLACTIVATRDLQLICAESPNLNATTNAFAVLGQGAVRSADLAGNGVQTSGIFAYDLTLAEIQRLTAKQSSTARGQSNNGRYQLATLSSLFDVVANANRTIGVYLQLLAPAYHDGLPTFTNNGTTMSRLLANELAAYGFTGRVCTPAWREQPIFVAADEAATLQQLAAQTDVPLVQVLAPVPLPYNRTLYKVNVTDADLANIARYAAAISPSNYQISPVMPLNYLDYPTGLASRAARQGLMVMPYNYTLSGANGGLVWTYHQDMRQELRYAVSSLGVQGLITDHVAMAKSEINTLQRAGQLPMRSWPAACMA